MHDGMSGETETFIHTYTTLKLKKKLFNLESHE